MDLRDPPTVASTDQTTPKKISSFADPEPWYRRGWGKVLIAVLVLVVVAAIATGIAVPLSRRSNGESAGAKDGAPEEKVDVWAGQYTGGDGSVVTASDGSTFVYNNTFGGHWNSMPFNDTAQAQSFVPSLDQPWDYQTHLINGVNIGGWFTIEPFISPALFEPFNPSSSTETPTVVDEYTLSVALGDKLAETVEKHYKTFVTEKDFAEIAGAGLSWVRIPIPFWFVDSGEGEPFLANVGWKYFLQALEWSRKYGLRVNLDLHTIPGSQNGYNHSGKQGSINFLNGAMGVANAQRTLSIIRSLTQFISQPQYKNLVPMFSIMNEPYATTISMPTLRSFYMETYDMIRRIGGTGEGNGPFIVFHDGFAPLGRTVENGGWVGWMNGLDRVGIDTHTYLCFTAPNNDGLTYQATKPCAYWAANLNATTAGFGLSMGGEWSLAFNDCGKWINNIGNGARYEGKYIIPGSPAGTAPQFEAVGECGQWTDWTAYSETTKTGLMLIARAHMDAFRNWFFWTWKTGVSLETGIEANPFWNYQLGLREGWIPADPRSAVGTCVAVTANQNVNMAMNPVGPLADDKVGKAVGTVNQAEAASYPWPPVTVGGGTPVSKIPMFTNTGVVSTLTGSANASPTPTSKPGWVNDSDGEGGWYVPIDGCSYPNAWSGAGAPTLTAPCTGPAATGMARVKRS